MTVAPDWAAITGRSNSFGGTLVSDYLAFGREGKRQTKTDPECLPPPMPGVPLHSRSAGAGTGKTATPTSYEYFT